MFKVFNMFLPAISSINQAIQPRVVGPLLQKRGDRVEVIYDVWNWLGTPGARV
jgi:hypothetical protein